MEMTMNPKVIRCKDPQHYLTIRQTSQDDSALFIQDPIAEAEKHAFERGLMEGERNARRLFESKAEAAARRYDQSIGEMAGAYRALVSAAETNAVQLAMAIARKVIQREFHIEPNDIAARATEALESVRTQPRIVLKVSVQDAARLRETVDQTNLPVVVNEDPSMKQGDFMIDTSRTHIDGRIASQLEQIEKDFLEE
jgi:flagellar biosynthesis/type III secretory pathway protein FliH